MRSGSSTLKNKLNLHPPPSSSSSSLGGTSNSSDQEEVSPGVQIQVSAKKEAAKAKEAARRNAYLYKRTRTLERVIGICVENITQLIKVHGWYRVNRQLQHNTRGKEFVCSMLYLMRMGITFKNQNILQRVDILNELLPMQVFLPSVFNIRAKSITEGENIIKLDIQKMPL